MSASPLPELERAGWHDYVRLARASNLPTCLSNVLAGAALGRAAAGDEAPVIAWASLGLTALGVALLYVAGMALNDWADAAVDAVERPSRPIPSGRVSRAAALRFVVVCLVAGSCAVLAAQWRAWPMLLALLASIVAYDLLHLRLGAAPVLMGLCRSLVYLTAAAVAYGEPVRWTGAQWALVGGPAAGIGAYTLGITLIAAKETGGPVGWRRWASLAMPVVVLASVWGARGGFEGLAWGFAALFVAWMALPILWVMRRPPQTVRAVLAWLSGMCLADACVLAALGETGQAGVAVACFALTAWGHRRVLGT
jgi:4-hydroxybenzoate polyprenyltransferase